MRLFISDITQRSSQITGYRYTNGSNDKNIKKYALRLFQYLFFQKDDKK